jgi:HAD superfamily hydrolase (TIGR01549 family)
MPKPRLVFFDVGNTLLFPNRVRILAPLAEQLHPRLDQWQNLERRTKREFDKLVLEGQVDRGFWWTFYGYLLEQSKVSDDNLRGALVKNTQNSANWDQIRRGTRESLDRIGRDYSISVISNSDGRIVEVLGRSNIADCFQSVTDSGIIGYEKPHPAIFEAALRTMQARPEESLYVGDVYSVDYLGARNIGMQAVLFDVAGAYRDRGFPRVESLEALELWLKG